MKRPSAPPPGARRPKPPENVPNPRPTAPAARKQRPAEVARQSRPSEVARQPRPEVLPPRAQAPAPSERARRVVQHSSREVPTNVTSRVNERLTERKRARTRLAYRKAGKVLGYLGLVLLAVWAVMSSALFNLRVEEVSITGEGTVVSLTQVQQLIVPAIDRPLTQLDVGALDASIRELNGVRDVAVTRVWPHGLTVEIFPREPVAAIPQDAGGFVLVDVDGVSVGQQADPPLTVPVVVVPVGEDNVRVLTAVLSVLEGLPIELISRIEDIRADTQDTVSFRLRQGPLVEWGSSENTALKAEVLLVMLADPATASAPVIDVSAPTLPITKNQ